MPVNPFLKRLGFGKKDRVVIFHADDIGMCQATLTAFREMIDLGPLTSGAVMVPCPWFLALAADCRANPGTDMGVHLTFTCEWQTYRWGPISTRDPASGLMDAEGCFYHTAIDAQTYANPDYIEPEVMAQVEQAIQAGIDLTHIDTHMGTMFHPNFLPIYLKAARHFKLPIMLVRPTRERLKRLKGGAKTRKKLKKLINQAEEDGWPVMDHLFQMPLQKPFGRLEDVTETLDQLAPGLTQFIIHPAKNTTELQAITADWRGRVADYQCFMQDELRDYLTKSGIYTLGYREIRDAIQASG